MNPRPAARRAEPSPLNQGKERPRLQRDLVVDTAVATADREGLDAVTIRRLAQELGVTPMALYWHFADKDALLRAMSERLWDDIAVEMDISRPDDDGWEQLTTITECLLTVLRRHPGCASLAPLAALGCRSGLDIAERALDLLAHQGLSPDRSADLAHFLLSTCITLVATQPGGHVSGPEEEREMRAMKRSMASLPAERYPRVLAAAPSFIDCPDEEVYYRHGIEFLIGGIRHQAGMQQKTATASPAKKRLSQPAPNR